MVFISEQFLAFFAVTVLSYYCLPLRLRWIWLLLASIFFYAYAQPLYLLQMLATTGAVYWLGLKLEQAEDNQRKQGLMAIGVALLVANLFVFKYASFFNESFRSVFGVVGAEYPVPFFQILLPLGISFYTFQLISYLIDVYRGDTAERHLGHFGLYVAFFPKIVAGPIERARNLLPQIKVDHAFDYALVAAGLKLAAWGVFKKVVVADRIAPIVDRVYNAPGEFDGVAMTFATWLYAFQIYCDFSGYTDIALGVAMIFGFKLMANFNRPYFATSIQDFWKRWHISLTSWLTDYVFNPLIRSKVIKIKWYNLMLLSMMVTFVVSGLWHGAQWTFVAWGALHGAFIVAGLLLQKPFNKTMMQIGLVKRPQLYRSLKIALTFSLVCFAYILFRANTMTDALYIMAQLPTGWGDAVNGLKDAVGPYRTEFMYGLAGIAVVMIAEILQGRVDLGATIAARPAWMRWGFYYAGALSIILFGAFYTNNQQFIYFQF